MELGEMVIATVALVAVTLSFPFLLYGAWIVIDAEEVTWDVLTHHLKYILTGLALTTIPMVTWMIPRVFDQLRGAAVVHAILGVQAYAMLFFAFTGIIPIFRAKREYDLYHSYDEQLLLDEIGDENMRHWRRHLRIGVFGYVILWILTYFVGVIRYVTRYLIG